MKDDLSQKIHGNMIFSSNVLKKNGLSKNMTLENDFSCCIIWKNGIFPPGKYGIFSLVGK